MRQSKTGRELVLPVTPDLQAAMDAWKGPRTGPIIRHPRRRKWLSPESLGNLFAEWIDQAGLPARCVLHGIRKGAVSAVSGGRGKREGDFQCERSSHVGDGCPLHEGGRPGEAGAGGSGAAQAGWERRVGFQAQGFLLCPTGGTWRLSARNFCRAALPRA
jgi:hypothetical protein